MRLNEREIALYAADPGRVDLKGFLLKRGESNSAFRQRWFVLKANILFYFKAPQDTIPIGFIFLEGCTTQVAQKEEVAWAFTIQFGGPSRSYVLVAMDNEDLNRWMRAIEAASFASLKNANENLLSENLRLRRQLGLSDEKTLSPSGSAEGPTLVANQIPGENDAELQRSGSVVASRRLVSAPRSHKPPTLELALKVTLTRTSDSLYETADYHIAVLRCEQVSGRFIDVGKTEIDCDLETTKQMFFKFRLYRIEDLDNERYKFWGEVMCTLADLVGAMGTELNISVSKENRSVDATDVEAILTIQPSAPVRDLPNQVIGDFRTCPATNVYFERITRPFRAITINSKPLKIKEVLSESVFTFIVPLAYLRLRIEEEDRIVRDFSDFIDGGNAVVDVLRRRQIDRHIEVLREYQNLVRFFSDYRGRSFRPSTTKKEEELQFIAVNLHLQEMVVEDKSSSPPVVTCYNVVTFGAPAAHSLGFKKGGAQTLASSTSTSSSNGSHEPTTSRGISNSFSRGILRLGALAGLRSDSSSSSHSGSPPSLSTAPLAASLVAASSGSSSHSLASPSSALASPSSSASLPPMEAALHGGLTETALALRHDAKSFQSAANDSGRQIKILLECAVVDKAALEAQRKALVDAETSLFDLCRQHPLTETDDTKRLVDKMATSAIPALAELIDSAAEGITEAKRAVLFNVIDQTLKTGDMLTRAVAGLLEQIVVKEDANRLTEVELRCRLDSIFAQALAALVTAFSAFVNRTSADSVVMVQVAEIGYLVHFESLLSTFSDEQGMLEDMLYAVTSLASVTFVLRPRDPEQTTPVFMEGKSHAPVIVLLVEESYFNDLPDSLRSGRPIAIVPLLFSRGINEQQMIANTLGDTSIQDRINKKSFDDMKKYQAKFEEFAASNGDKPSFAEADVQRVKEGMAEVEAALTSSKRERLLDILVLTEKVARSMNGGRLTSCKSAKDRTSMAVTLEETNLLTAQHQVPADIAARLRVAMRSQGVRIRNAEKNTGTARYAFNYLQIKTLPERYQPPRWTAGGGTA